MTEYALYLESGPRRKKTMIHVPDLLGCIAQGPTTEDALAATPDAIRAFLRFLLGHGDAVQPDAPFTTAVAAHVTEGGWLGNGDPAPGFAPDFGALSPEDLGAYLQRLGWLRDDLARVLGGLSVAQLLAEPAVHGRPIFEIVMHVAKSQGAYVRATVGKVDGLAEALRNVGAGPDGLAAALDRLWHVDSARLAAMTEDERTRQVQHGQVLWTARRGMRRMLEHTWEHLREIRARLGEA